ncbi:MAG: AAA family ATPase [Sulfuricurvum sp.]|nr:AAA family ATPase [Sulfuricurvum sp.]
MEKITNANEALEWFNQTYQLEQINTTTENKCETVIVDQSAKHDVIEPKKQKSKRQINWDEKYRPQTLSEIILPLNMAKYFTNVIKHGDTPNLGLFSKMPGTGKSSLVNILKNELLFEALDVNASSDRGIDFMRDVVKRFTELSNFFEQIRYVVFEESDQLTQEAQKLLKQQIEKVNNKCQFIFTANDISKLDKAVLSRLEVFDLDDEFAKDKAYVQPLMIKKLMQIAKLEQCDVEQSVIESIVSKRYPSMRNMTLDLKKHCRSYC